MAIKNKLQIFFALIVILTIFYSGTTYAVVDPGTPAQPSIPEGECKYKNSGAVVECNVAIHSSLVYMARDSITSSKAKYSSEGYDMSTTTYIYKITINSTNKDSGTLTSTRYRLSDGRNLGTTTATVVVKGTPPTFPASTPPAPSPTPDPDPNPSSGATTTPSEPLEVGFGETVDVDTDLSSTKGCGADGKYTSGILKGVSCSGATKTKEEVVQIIKNIIEDFLLPTVGVIFVTVIVLGGLVYITSGGNEESVKRGKKILTSGIIGFLIVTLSYTLIRIFVALLGGNIV